MCARFVRLGEYRVLLSAAGRSGALVRREQCNACCVVWRRETASNLVCFFRFSISRQLALDSAPRLILPIFGHVTWRLAQALKILLNLRGFGLSKESQKSTLAYVWLHSLHCCCSPADLQNQSTEPRILFNFQKFGMSQPAVITRPS